MKRHLCLIVCICFFGCGSAGAPQSPEVLRNNLSDFQGVYCDAGNYGGLWELLSWTRIAKPVGAKVKLRLDPSNSMLHAQLLGSEGAQNEEHLVYEYRAPFLWVQRHFEVSGWPAQFWMRLGVSDAGLVVLPPEEEPETHFRTHLRVAPGGNCRSSTSQ